MSQKKLVLITQAEIDIATEEFLKNGGVIKILKIEGSKTKEEADERRKNINPRNSA